MQNAGLTWSQDLGAVTELLSGEFFQPLGRSSSHQVWSSAMVIAPALYGLFGLDWDALHRTLRLSPSLPVAWDTAHLRNVPLGDLRIDLDFAWQGGRLIITAKSASSEFCLAPQTAPRDRDCSGSGSSRRELVLPLPAVEAGVPGGLPLPGSRTTNLKVIGEHLEANRYALELEAPGGSEYQLPLRFNRPGVRTSGAEVAGSSLRVRFPAGEGYMRASVAFTW